MAPVRKYTTGESYTAINFQFVRFLYCVLSGAAVNVNVGV